jgi:hypothetical protein
MLQVADRVVGASFDDPHARQRLYCVARLQLQFGACDQLYGIGSDSYLPAHAQSERRCQTCVSRRGLYRTSIQRPQFRADFSWLDKTMV